MAPISAASVPAEPTPAATLVLPERLRASAAEQLKKGEEVLAGCFTVIGPSILVCGWLGPLTLAMFRDKKHLVLTTSRVLILDAVPVSTRPGGLFAAIPRDRVVLVSAKPGRFINVLRLNVAGHVLRIEVDRHSRPAYDIVVKALQASGSGSDSGF